MFGVLTFILMAVSGLPQNAPNGILEISVASFWTNYSVRATVTARSREGSRQAITVSTNDFGRLRLELPAGEYELTVSAEGYKTMETHYPSEPGRRSASS